MSHIISSIGKVAKAIDSAYQQNTVQADSGSVIVYFIKVCKHHEWNWSLSWQVWCTQVFFIPFSSLHAYHVAWWWWFVLKLIIISWYKTGSRNTDLQAVLCTSSPHSDLNLHWACMGHITDPTNFCATTSNKYNSALKYAWIDMFLQ